MIEIYSRKTSKDVVKSNSIKERKPLQDLSVNKPATFNALAREKQKLSSFSIYDESDNSGEKNSTIALKKSSKSDMKCLIGKIAELNTTNSTNTNANVKVTVPNTVPIIRNEMTPQFIPVQFRDYNHVPKEQKKQNTTKDQSACHENGYITDDAPSEKNDSLPKMPTISEPKETENDNQSAGSFKESNIDERKTVTLNAQAKEWKHQQNDCLTGDTLENVKSFNYYASLAKMWEMKNNDVNVSAAYQQTDNASSPKGRKIVGRGMSDTTNAGSSGCAYNQFPKRQPIKDTDDRSSEALRFQRQKEARRRKAIEAMRVENERNIRCVNTMYNGAAAKNTHDQPSMANSVQNANFNIGTMKTERLLEMRNFQRSSPLLYPCTNAPQLRSNAGFGLFYEPKQIECFPYCFPIRYGPDELLKMNYDQKRVEGIKSKRVVPKKGLSK